MVPPASRRTARSPASCRIHQGLRPQPRDRPGDTLLAIILVLGLWLFGAGVVEIIRGMVYPGQRLLALLTGAIDVIIAILILSWPKESLGTLAILTGIAFIIRGALMAYRGIHVPPPRGRRRVPLRPAWLRGRRAPRSGDLRGDCRHRHSVAGQGDDPTHACRGSLEAVVGRCRGAVGDARTQGPPGGV